jgi:hypothetical protein
MEALKVTFRGRGLSFRHFPQSKCAELRWQAIREIVEPVTFPDGTWCMIERFELIAWAMTSDALIDQLG